MRKLTLSMTWACLLVCLCTIPLSAQVSSFDDEEACISFLPPVPFSAVYSEIAATTLEDFLWSSPDVVFEIELPPDGLTLSFSTQSGAGVDYDVEILNIANVDAYLIDVTVSNYPATFNGITFTLAARDPAQNTIDDDTAQLFLMSPPSGTITSPATMPGLVCEGGTIEITTSLTGFPNSFQWQKDGVSIPGATSQDLTITPAVDTDAGIYQLLLIDNLCGITPGPVASIAIVPPIVLTEDDMAPKDCAPGVTVTFTASAENIDDTSTYTWDIGGSSFTSATVPGTVVVNGNTLQVNSITNTPTSATSVSSTVSLTNISATGSPAYSADVFLTVTNNAACVAIAPSEMTNTTQAFPVEWADFQLKQQEDGVKAIWSTATETNNAGFILERSLDGQSYKQVAEIVAIGNSDALQTYSYFDTQAPNGQLLYYRVKQIDYDGASSYSDIRKIQLDGQDKLSLDNVAVLPASIKATVLSPMDGDIQATIYDLRGVMIAEQVLPLINGNNAVEFSISQELPQGIYILHLHGAGQSISKRFFY